MNIVDSVLYQCRRNPPAPAICAPGTTIGVISYARLERSLHNIGRRALAEGLAPGNTVAILVRDHIFHAALILGLARIGVTTLSVAALDFPKALAVDAVVTDHAMFPPNPFNVKVMAVDLRWMEGDATPVDERHVTRGSDAIMRIALTSGSTGEPKAIALSHDMITRRAWHYMLTLGDDFMRCSRVFSDLGLGSDMCVRLMLHLLSRGGTMFLPGATPMDTLQGFELYRVEGMIASPGGLSAIVKFYEDTPAFRSSFAVIATAGSALHRSLSQRVRARLCSDLLFYYGSSETGIVAAAPAHVVADLPGAVGPVAAGVRVTIADDYGRALPPGEEGAVRISSATTVTGYLGDPEQTAASFRDGVFLSGDLGCFSKDGLLVISGRAREVLNLGGVKVKPEAIEEVLGAFPAVAEAAVYAVPDQDGIDEVRALVVANAPLDSGALKAHCQQRLPPPLVPVQVAVCEKLPRNDNGKIERHRLKAFADNVKSS